MAVVAQRGKRQFFSRGWSERSFCSLCSYDFADLELGAADSAWLLYKEVAFGKLPNLQGTVIWGTYSGQFRQMPAHKLRFDTFRPAVCLFALRPHTPVGIGLRRHYRAGPVILRNLCLADVVEVVLGLLIGPAIPHLTNL